MKKATKEELREFQEKVFKILVRIDLTSDEADEKFKLGKEEFSKYVEDIIARDFYEVFEMGLIDSEICVFWKGMEEGFIRQILFLAT